MNDTIQTENEIDEIENDLKRMDSELQIIQGQYSDVKREIQVLKRDISDKEIKKTDLLKILTTCKHNINRKQLDLSLKKREFWRNK